MHASPPQLLFSVAAGDAVQRAGHAGGAYAALPRPRPLRAEWLAVLLPPAAAGRALSLRPRGCCLNRRAVPGCGQAEARHAEQACPVHMCTSRSRACAKASQLVIPQASVCDTHANCHSWACLSRRDAGYELSDVVSGGGVAEAPAAEASLSPAAPHAEAAQAAEHRDAGQPATVTELWTGYQNSEARPT